MNLKSIFTLFTCLILSCPILVSAQEGQAFKGSYEECLTQAKKENKLILIDLYFAGCMPCAEMDKQTFPDPAVVHELQSNYILFKTDVLKEMDGKKLARKYGAPGFPTYVIVNGDGKTLLMESGFFATNNFVPLLQKAVQLNTSGQLLAFNSLLDNTYPPAYSERFIKTGEKHDFAELKGYLEQQPDLYNEVAIVANSVTSFPEYNNWTYDNLPTILNMYGGNLMRNKMSTIARIKSKEFGKEQQLDSFQNMLNYIRPTFNNKLWDVYLPIFATSYYTGSKNAAIYFKLIEQYDLYPTWDLRSNALGQVIIDQAQKPKVLKSILSEYMTEQHNKDFDAIDSYRLTLLYSYLGEYTKASKIAQDLLKVDFNAPGLALKKEEVLELKKAIDRKNIRLYDAKNIQKTIPFSLS